MLDDVAAYLTLAPFAATIVLGVAAGVWLSRIPSGDGAAEPESGADAGHAGERRLASVRILARVRHPRRER